ncbi:hypothetical protein TeGR_g14883 [Tetraparma gracilis]|uniref:Proline racemase n=1 Tax=Tetraparma gracilis TaxID=2962635 RepID=A0ABQ6MGJ4_9STRA|nr:hypothetical protein TeGR_g14883 [Tetraparma gracilis]
MTHLDHLRKLLITEPRGYPCQNVDFILPPTDPRAAFGFVIGEQAKVYPLMSGHNTICVATVLLESNLVPMQYPVTKFLLEAPGGLVEITAQCESEKATKIKILNVPAFVHALNLQVTGVPSAGVGSPSLPPITVDLAYGGMHYCVVDAAQPALGGLPLVPSNGKRICRLGEMIKTRCREQHPVNHPSPDLHYPGCDILVFRSENTTQPGASARNAVVMSNGGLDWENEGTWSAMLDRSPCGTGTCAVMAVLHAKQQLGLGEDFVHESIVGSLFTGRLLEEKVVWAGGEGGSAGDSRVVGVQPTVEGQAWITQHCKVVLHETDPFPAGFTVSDIWA